MLQVAVSYQTCPAGQGKGLLSHPPSGWRFTPPLRSLVTSLCAELLSQITGLFRLLKKMKERMQTFTVPFP